MVDQFDFPSMPKREIIEIRLKKSLLKVIVVIRLQEGDFWRRLHDSIIILLLMSNLLFFGKTTTYMV